jgi:ribonuclease HII
MQPRVGVDEAGKGPVLGAMFAGAVRVVDGTTLPEGLADSKDLAAGRREALDAALREREGVEVAVAAVSVERIDDPATDMNTLTVDGQAEAVAGAVRDGDRVVADAGDTSETRFAGRLADRIDADVDLAAEHGADATHEVVSAASVVAKVARDAHVESLAVEHPELVEDHGPLGSGYPGDPATRSFLESYVDEHGAVPPFARASWSTCEDLLADAEQSGLGEF